MAGIRAWLAAAVVCALIVPAAASAAAPGDKVAFQIPDSDRGDAYTISVDQTKAADGVDDTDDPGISGEFTMPDLGSRARTVTVTIDVKRAADGSEHSYESEMDYAPAGSAESQPASKPAPARPPAQPPATSSPAARPRAPLIVPPPSSSTSPAPQPATLVDPGAPRTPERILHGLSGRAVSLRRSGAPAGHRRAGRHARRARHQANHFRPGPDPSPPRVSSPSPPRDTRADLSDDRFPGLGYSVAWRLLAAVMAAGLLLPLLVGVRTRLRAQMRPGNPVP